MLIERYNEVKKHVEEACKRVGRDPREVTVIAVSKTKPLEMVEGIPIRITAHPRGAFISVGDPTPAETNLPLLTT